MKTGRNNRDDDNDILDAVLTDEHWQALSGELKHQALTAMAQARHRRQLRANIGQAILAVSLLGLLAWWFRSPSSKSVVTENSRPIPNGAIADPHYVSEEQMLAMFPEGSCVVAEVDGRKELVFFDAEAAKNGFVRGSPP